MKRRLFSIILISVMILNLTACNKTKSTGEVVDFTKVDSDTKTTTQEVEAKGFTDAYSIIVDNVLVEFCKTPLRELCNAGWIPDISFDYESEIVGTNMCLTDMRLYNSKYPGVAMSIDVGNYVSENDELLLDCVIKRVTVDISLALELSDPNLPYLNFKGVELGMTKDEVVTVMGVYNLPEFATTITDWDDGSGTYEYRKDFTQLIVSFGVGTGEVYRLYYATPTVTYDED